MTNRDFDQDDAEVLAEFAVLEIFKVGEEEVIVEHPKTNGIPVVFQPWSYKASQWQIQSCKDAVREKGLEDKFINKLSGVLETRTTTFSFASAPPEAICSAVLEIIPEGSGE